MAELSDTEEKRLSGLRVERDELNKELHETRRAVSIDFRNREQKRMQRLALHTDKLEKSVNEILLHQDQMIKLSQNCMKLEEENDEECSKYSAAVLEFSKIDQETIKRANKKIASYNPLFKNLDVIVEKENTVSLQVATLRHEAKTLTRENDELKSLLKEYFHTLATSSDLGTWSMSSFKNDSCLFTFLRKCDRWFIMFYETCPLFVYIS